MVRRTQLALAAVLLCSLAGPSRAHAQDSMKDWLARILDPATLGVTPPEGATLNRKITVDTIHLDRDHPEKKIAIYMMPLDKLAVAKAHFATALGIDAQSGTDSKGVEKHFFDCRAQATCPAKAKGLTVAIGRSPWVDGMTQIQLEYPGSKP